MQLKVLLTSCLLVCIVQYCQSESDAVQSTQEHDAEAEKEYEAGMSLINLSKAHVNYRAAYQNFKKASDLGHIKSKEELAKFYYFGYHVQRNITHSRELFEEIMKLNSSAHSQFFLGFFQSNGLSLKSNQAKALVYLTFGALGGDVYAQMSMGYRYFMGINVENSCEMALNYYRKVATHVAGQINTFGSMNTNGISTSQVIHRIRLYDEDENLASQQQPTQALLDDDLVQYYQLLADRGDIQAQYGLGLLHYQGARIDMNIEKALYYFSRAAEAGNYYAMAYLGKLYLEGGPNVKQDNQTAYQYFKASSEKNNPIGQAGLGLMYFHGATGVVDRDYMKALKLFQQSSDQGYVEGHFLLAIMYYYGYGIRKDYKMAVKYFNLAAQLGHVLAFYNLAQMHANGMGILRSCQTATELYKNVAERGRWSYMFMDAHAAYKDGDLDKALIKYIFLAELGYEVAQSNVAYILDQYAYKRALLFWNRAAQQGYHVARLKLGDYYYYGHGTEIDYQQAATHYKYATEISHNPQAMFNLAWMHEQGLGLKRDIHLAKRFYDLASETSGEAYIPVTLALIKLNFLFYLEFLKQNYENLSGLYAVFDLYWDIFLMFFIGVFTALYVLRRRRN